MRGPLAGLHVKGCQTGQAGDLIDALWTLEPAYLRAISSLRTPLANYDEELGRTARLSHSVLCCQTLLC